MTDANTADTSRRNFLKNTGRVAAASTLVAGMSPRAFASEDNTIQVALVGCGGRGTGAAANALSVKNGPIKLVAMADVFEDRQSDSYNGLAAKFSDQPNKVDVPEERRFIGFEAYKQAMDCLKPGDVVILATPPAFRWVQFTYAIEKGLNVFMEKPVTVDGPTSRKMFALGEESAKRNLKVGVGLMCRHCDARAELHERIQQGEIGEILELRAYRMAGPTGSAAVGPKPADANELEYQIRNFHAFLWASGGAFSDFLIHNIDECCWMKNAFPIEAKASGGRQYRGNDVDQNFDSYSVEYTFEDGTKLMLNGRTIPGCHHEFASYAHGTKGAAVISTASHSPAKCRIYKGWNLDEKNLVWAYPQPEKSPYQLEWDHLIDAIRNDKPYNEVQRGVEASLVTSMGRMAAHTGKIITRDQILNGDHEFAPVVDQLALGGEAPLVADSNGKYPIPLPGLLRREY
ncbi:Inositol 2-dehydrogenase/D-chiro-inositol 3-dehydrogenase [Symmachiella macrocystis]|uniref:Inositol 2-dehydrogenase/D-chiro-inositol 3-dehydrogenase n=1 Tax=Symmachiella macrocystis TaxID=2527985 RepID=A0A5C6BSX8_9PLAN|nr:Gfo/Idh/MocA family oxidoreductase [Symmachiella macrocystis]TWU13989.1 Inositol 2-dehydrogenase/D-chiro-inositol 3-dehydrogenase [Symmachiella macrocystis]